MSRSQPSWVEWYNEKLSSRMKDYFLFEDNSAICFISRKVTSDECVFFLRNSHSDRLHLILPDLISFVEKKKYKIINLGCHHEDDVLTGKFNILLPAIDS